MNGTITIKANKPDNADQEVSVLCHMRDTSLLDRFNLVSALAEALKFDDAIWKLYREFRCVQDIFQSQKKTMIDLSGAKDALQEE